MCYNSLWLRVALEMVFGETIPIHEDEDVSAILTQFILERVLYSHEIARKYAHPTVPNSYKAGWVKCILFIHGSIWEFTIIRHEILSFEWNNFEKNLFRMMTMITVMPTFDVEHFLVIRRKPAKIERLIFSLTVYITVEHG